MNIDNVVILVLLIDGMAAAALLVLSIAILYGIWTEKDRERRRLNTERRLIKR